MSHPVVAAEGGNLSCVPGLPHLVLPHEQNVPVAHLGLVVVLVARQLRGRWWRLLQACRILFSSVSHLAQRCV